MIKIEIKIKIKCTTKIKIKININIKIKIKIKIEIKIKIKIKINPIGTGPLRITWIPGGGCDTPPPGFPPFGLKFWELSTPTFAYI